MIYSSALSYSLGQKPPLGARLNLEYAGVHTDGKRLGNVITAWWLFNEGVGSNVIDCVNGVNGTYWGSCQPSSNGITVGSSLGYVAVPTKPFLNSDNVSVMIYAYPTSYQVDGKTCTDIFRKAIPYGSGYVLRPVQSQNVYNFGFRVDTSKAYAIESANSSIYLNGIHMFAGTYDNTTATAKLYIDGLLKATGTGTPTNGWNTDNIYIMGQPNTNSYDGTWISGTCFSCTVASVALSYSAMQAWANDPYLTQSPGAWISSSRVWYSIPSGIILTGTAIAVANALGATRASTRVPGVGVSASIASGSTAAKTKVIGTSVSASNALGTTKAATRLIGAATSAAVANGVANAKTLIIGTCIAASNAIGNVKAKTILIGNAIAVAVANGALRTGASITFAGTAIAACVASGALKASTRIQGTAISATNALGSITAKTRIIGTVISAAVGAGVMKGKTRITGTCVAASNALGTINAKARLIGTVTSAAVSNGVLKAKTYIIGTCVAASNAMGEMNAVTRITGTAIAACIAISRFLNSIIFNPVTKSARGDGVTKSARGDIITKSGRKN